MPIEVLSKKVIFEQNLGINKGRSRRAGNTKSKQQSHRRPVLDLAFLPAQLTKLLVFQRVLHRRAAERTPERPYPCSICARRQLLRLVVQPLPGGRAAGKGAGMAHALFCL